MIGAERRVYNRVYYLAHREQALAYAHERTVAKRAARCPERICGWCGKSFIPQRSDTFGCCIAHRRRLAPSQTAEFRRLQYPLTRNASLARKALARKLNPDQIRALERARYERHPEIYRGKTNRQRVRSRSGDIRSVAPKDLRRLETGGCFYCGADATLTFDHIIPVLRGGRHAIGNLVGACKPCNSSKGSKLLIQWRSLTRQGTSFNTGY